MPVPSSISDLSATPSLNSPAGTESPSTVDDYLRTQAAFIRQVDDKATGTVKAADLAAPGGSALVGFQQPDAGASPRTMQDRARDVVYVDDFFLAAEADSTGMIQRAIEAIKVRGGGKVKLSSKNYNISDTVTVGGNFGYRGFTLSGDNATITMSAAKPAIVFDAKNPTPAPQYKQRSLIEGIEIVGPGRTTVGAYGLVFQNGARMVAQDVRIRGFERGIYGYGALISRFREVELYNNDYGFYFEKSDLFNPNDIHFNSCFIFENIRAGYASNFPNGAITFNECEIEGHNYTNGNAADGLKCLEFDNAGKVSFIGCHLEANYAQWHILYAGGGASSSLTMIASECIPGDKNAKGIEMANTYGSLGHLAVINSRVTSNAGDPIYINTGCSALVIGDNTAAVTGDLSRVVVQRFGRIATGRSTTPANAGMRSKGGAGIAHDFEGFARWVNAADTRLGYISVADGGAMSLVNDNDGKSIQFATKVSGVAATRLHINRVGTNTLEPGEDNTYSLGTAALRWGTVYAGTGTINTSDARTKQQIRPLSDAEQAVAIRLKSLVRAFKFNDAVNEKGEAARIHFGVIAQDVKSAFESEGLVAEDYAILCHDSWDDIVEDVVDENGQPTGEKKVSTPAGDRYGVRYEQLLAFIVSAL